MRSVQRWFESAFETFLFNSRLIVILAVIGSLTSSVLMFVRGVIVIWHTAKDFFHHISDPHGGEELSIALISSVDSFLFATVLLIFAMGIYELFISKIDPASRTAESRPNWLQIHSLDDLKSAVGKVILMILIVRLFESAVKMKYDTPLHLLYLGLSVLFVAGALFLQHASHKHDKKHDDHAKHAKDENKEAHTTPAHAPAPHTLPPAVAHPAPLSPELAYAASVFAQGHGAHAHEQAFGAPAHPGQIQPVQPYPTMPPAQPPHGQQQAWGHAQPQNAPAQNGQPQSHSFIPAPRSY